MHSICSVANKWGRHACSRRGDRKLFSDLAELCIEDIWRVGCERPATAQDGKRRTGASASLSALRQKLSEDLKALQELLLDS